MNELRSFKSSAEARAAGFSTIQWLRAFSFQEHSDRIRVSQSLTEQELGAV